MAGWWRRFWRSRSGHVAEALAPPFDVVAPGDEPASPLHELVLLAEMAESLQRVAERDDTVLTVVQDLVFELRRTREELLGAIAALPKSIGSVRGRVEVDERDPSLAPAVAEVLDLSASEETPDGIYLQHLQRITGHSSVSTLAGRLLTITVIGRLRDGSVGWWCEDEFAAGRLSSQLLGDLMPQEGDYLRARVVSHEWGHVVIALVPGSLRSPVAVRAASAYVADQEQEIPESVRGSWKERVRAGTIVLARVPFDGYLPIDRQGRLAKERPSLFMRWENEYAVLRPIYDSRGWVGRGDLGSRLRDTFCLTKPSVVRDAEYDIDPNNLLKELGQIGKNDALTLGIPVSVPVSGPTTPAAQPSAHGSPDAPPDVPTTASVEPPGLVGELCRYVRAMGGVRDHAHLVETSVVFALRQQRFRDMAGAGGLPFSELGNLVAQSARYFGAPRGSSLSEVVVRVLEGASEATGLVLEVSFDHNNLPVLIVAGAGRDRWTTERTSERSDPRPIDRDVEYVDERAPGFVLTDDYETPDLILLDQYSTARMAGDHRVRLDEELERLRVDSSAPAFVIGSDAEAGWAAFQRAARTNGWEVAIAHERDEALQVAADLVHRHGAQLVTVISTFVDMVGELENRGIEVQLVTAVG